MRNIAIVGAGRWGKNLVRNFDLLGALHTICDTNELLVDQLEKDYPNLKHTPNYHNVLKDPDIKGVVISAPAAQHFTLAKDALIAGKDVFVEKPLCLVEEEAEKLVALAKEKNSILMVGHLLHYHPYVIKLKEMITSGMFGQILYITSNRLDLGPIRNEENALWNYAPHDISVILSLSGNQLPSQITCSGTDNITPGIQDNSLISLEFDKGIRAHIYVSWLNPFKEQKLVVVGSEGMGVFDDTMDWDKKLKFTKVKISWARGNIPYLENSTHEYVVVPRSEPLYMECKHFITCCQKREQPLTDGVEGLRVIKVLNAAQKKLLEPVDAPPDLSYYSPSLPK